MRLESRKAIAGVACDQSYFEAANESVVLVEADETCGGRFPTRIPSPGVSLEVEWIPGAVYVILAPNFHPERLKSGLSDAEDFEANGVDFVELIKIFRTHDLQSYEPTFSYTPPGQPVEEEPPPDRERYYTLHFPAEKLTVDISEELRRNPLIEWAAPVAKVMPPTNPAHESLVLSSLNGVNQQWYVPRCRVHLAWNPQSHAKGVSGKKVVVADIDWGFRTSHHELCDRIELAFNSIDGTEDINQGCLRYHGTAVLGILGAKASGVGMVGFAYESDLWAIQAGSSETEFNPKFWVAAIDHVRRTSSQGRRRVICLEAEHSGRLNIEGDIAVNKAIRDAIAADIVVCVAAGNGNSDAGLDARGEPILETGSIVVGATVFDADPAINRRAGFSNWGDRIAVSAPGDMENDVSCSSGADNGYLNRFGGTSGATPKVAGTVALMLEANPKLAPSEIKSILNATGTPITDVGTKLIGTFLNAEAAVAEARRLISPPVARQPLSTTTTSPDSQVS